MKRYILLLIVAMSFNTSIFAQGTVDIMVENPRIITIGTDEYFDFDIYARKTGVWGTGVAGEQVLSNSSFYFDWNFTDCTLPSMVIYNTTVFPVLAYTVSVGTTGGALNNEKLYVDVVETDDGPVWLTDEIYWLFTVRFKTNASSNPSLVQWRHSETGLTHSRHATSGISLTESFYDSDCDIALNTKCWTGATGGATGPDWDNPGNWSPAGVPIATDDIIYPNNPTTALSIFNSTTFDTLQNLRINHLAQMTIPQSHGITVTAGTALKGGNNLVISSVAGSGTASYIPQGAINYNAYSLEAGHIEVQRYIDNIANPGDYYHHQVAAPVGGVILDDWDIIPGSTYAYEYRAANILDEKWFNIYMPSRQTPSGYGFLLSSLNTTDTKIASFYDNVETGPVIVNTVIDSLNLLGNPYTSPISWSSLFANNPTVIDLVYIWDPTIGNYISANSVGGNLSARYIQLGQSFFVQTTIAPFTFNAADRVHTVAPYMKDEYTNYMKVYTQGGNSTSDELYLMFKDAEVTGGFDENHDAIDWPSIYGELATEIYTVGTDNQNLTIDARPPIGDNNIDIPLHFKAGVDAVYTLGTDFLDTFDPDIHIFLEDTHIPGLPWINLKEEGSYTFNASPEDDYGRFVLHFYESAFGIEENGYEAITIYSSRTDAYIINKSEQLIKEIHVYDIMGNLLLRKAEVNAAFTKIYVSDKAGYYVVKVITDKAVYSEKLLISK